MNVSETRRPSVILHPRTEGNIDVFRRENDTLKYRTLHLPTAREDLQKRIDFSVNSINASQRFLGLSLTISAILMAEGIKRRSKVLTVASALLGTGGLYVSEKQVAKHTKELEWLEKEAIQIKIYQEDSHA